MHYCTRSRGRRAFFGRIAASSFGARVQFRFDDGVAEQKLQMQPLLATPRSGLHLYVCGPKGFMDAVLNTACAAGWPAAQLHYEFFSGGPVISADDASFESKLASSGKVVRVAKDETVVQSLAAAGIEVPTSCEQGVCGTCLIRVLEGEPDHKDAACRYRLSRLRLRDARRHCGRERDEGDDKGREAVADGKHQKIGEGQQ